MTSGTSASTGIFRTGSFAEVNSSFVEIEAILVVFGSGNGDGKGEDVAATFVCLYKANLYSLKTLEDYAIIHLI